MLYGNRSLEERFGKLSGRSLQDQIFTTYEEKYTADNYKTAKALKNKLKAFRIFDEWCEFFGKEADFLSSDMASAEMPIRNINAFGSCLENFAGGNHAEDLGYVLMEISKLCVPASAQEKLGVIMAGSIFVKKVVKAASAVTAPVEGQGTKRKAASLPDFQPKKAAKAKAKGKAKAKATARPGPDSVGGVETAEDLEADIVMPATGGHRQRKWLDDVLSAVKKASALPGESVSDGFESYGSSSRSIAIAQAIQVSLRFAFTGGIQLNGKYQKDWSKVRPAIQSLLRKAVGRGTNGIDQVFSDMMVGAAEEEKKTNVDGSNSKLDPAFVLKSLLKNEAVVQACQSWVQLNNSNEVQNHPGFGKLLKELMTGTGCTCEEWDAAECPLHDSSTTIADFVWGASDCLRYSECVPIAVPVLASSCLMKVESDVAAYHERRKRASEEHEKFTEKAGGLQVATSLQAWVCVCACVLSWTLTWTVFCWSKVHSFCQSSSLPAFSVQAQLESLSLILIVVRSQMPLQFWANRPSS
ncbi:unnamed protein product [Durusdinium trenchii]|uniref:Uncharacterized protein n=1 Tax=Durusdinium trenchii TaxID=1381693 RepID=A0ABP0N6V9_9DINO